MNINNLIQILSYVYGICTLLVLSCSIMDLAGNTTQTGNGKTQTVAGVFYEPDGTTPAPGARVTIHQLGASNQINSGNVLKKSVSGMGTVYTDAQGKFAFSSLQDKGPYMIDAEQGETLFAMIEYVAFNGDDTLVDVMDTLKEPGSAKAVVCFNYQDMRVEKATFEFSSYYQSEFDGSMPYDFIFTKGYGAAWIDSAHNCNGVMTFNNMPEGLYTLRAVIKFPIDENGNKEKDVCLKKPGILVKSGQVTDLDTLRIPEMLVPNVEQCGIRYDIPTGTIQVDWSWNAKDTDNVSGVNIYQQSISKFPLKINADPIKGPVFTDTGFWDFPRRPEIQTEWMDSTYDTIIFNDTMPFVDIISIDNKMAPYDKIIPKSDTFHLFDTIPHNQYTIPVQTITPAFFLMSVGKNGNESWKVHSLSAGSIWWKKENGIPFLPDTLPISWPDIF
jgi:hypothetical protein